jgi:hypothetical protein
VAPQQCPNCGRFLKKTLVEGLAEGDEPCPGCEVALTASMFDTSAAETSPGSEAPSASGDGGEDAPTDAASVRPPDLPPDEVRDDAGEVLEGWDRGAGVNEISSWRDDRPPFPTDAAAVLGGAVGGAVVGALASPRRLRGALLGSLVGALIAAVLRQVWRSPG